MKLIIDDLDTAREFLEYMGCIHNQGDDHSTITNTDQGRAYMYGILQEGQKIIVPLSPKVMQFVALRSDLAKTNHDLLKALKVASLYVSSISNKPDWKLIQAAINKATE